MADNDIKVLRVFHASPPNTTPFIVVAMDRPAALGEPNHEEDLCIARDQGRALAGIFYRHLSGAVFDAFRYELERLKTSPFNC